MGAGIATVATKKITIQVRVTEEEHAKYTRYAKRLGLTGRSAFLRHCAAEKMTAMDRDAPPRQPRKKPGS